MDRWTRSAACGRLLEGPKGHTDLSSVCPFGPSVHRSIGPSVHRSIGPSVHRSIGPSVHRSSSLLPPPSPPLHLFPMARSNTHRWAVDGISDGMARVEEDGERMITVPAYLLPAGVREGQVLQVTS